MLGPVVRNIADVVNGTIGDIHVHRSSVSVDDYSKVIGPKEIGILDCAASARAVVDHNVAACAIDSPAHGSWWVDERRGHVDKIAEKAGRSASGRRQRIRDRDGANAH